MDRLAAYFQQVMVEERAGVRAEIARAAAEAVSRVYAAGMDVRNRAYDRGWLRSVRLGRAVVSVGNLSAGGTGKTPVVAFLASRLMSAGHKPAVLLRGYRAQGERSDEADELAESIPAAPGGGESGGGEAGGGKAAGGKAGGGWRVPVYADADRVRASQRAIAERPEIDVFVLDDGMQHRRVSRQAEVVLVSSTQGLCGGHVLPRGLLRERPEGLGRADVVVLTRCDQAEPGTLDRLEAEVSRLAPGKPVLRCWHAPTEVLTSAGERWAPEVLRGRRVFAVAGTGDPGAFRTTLHRLGATLAGSQSFRDHHPYTPSDLAEVARRARACGADAVITTGKDFVKLRALPPVAPPLGIDVWTLRVEVRFEGSGAETLLGLVRSRLG